MRAAGTRPGRRERASSVRQPLCGDRRAHLLRETTPGRYRAVTSQSGWTTYNGQVSGNRYSTLTQITADNVARLAPRWVFTLPNVSQGQVTPVVVDGLMYVSAANDLYALDAGSGRQVWNYRRPRTRGLAGVAARGVNRGVAVSGERVFMATDHAHLIALNRSSGALLWETQMADWHQNYNGTGAPMVVGDLVIAGIAGGDEGARGFVAAYEQTTGKEVWRFWAVPARGMFTRVDQTWESGKSFMGGTFAAAPEAAQRVLRAIDIQTGKVTWELPLTTAGPLRPRMHSQASGYGVSKPVRSGSITDDVRVRQPSNADDRSGTEHPGVRAAAAMTPSARARMSRFSAASNRSEGPGIPTSPPMSVASLHAVGRSRRT